MIPEIQMIALDLDGTTLARGKLTPRTRQALEEAIRRGIHVVIATGRVFSALPEDIFTIRGLEYVVTSNGAMITELNSQNVIYENCIGREALETVDRLLRQHPELPVEVFTCGGAYIDRNVYEDLKEHGSSYMSRSYVLRTRKPVDGILDFMEENMDSIENINIYFEFREKKAELREELLKIPEITLTASMPHNLEIGGASTSKASGLAALCNLTGISLHNTMACGDSLNDMAMLSEVGFGVAMGNAEKEILDLADYVAPSCDEEGVAFVVEKFALGLERPGWQLAILTLRNRILSRTRRLARKILRRGKGRT